MTTACITSAQFLYPHLDLMFLYFPSICLLLHAFPRMSVRLYINNIQRDSKRWTQFYASIFPELYMVYE